MASRDHDWRALRKSGDWSYKGLDDPKYIKDRNKLFEENGNGWWFFAGLRYSPSHTISKEKHQH